MSQPRQMHLASCYSQYSLQRLATDAQVVAEGQVVASSSPVELRPRGELRSALPDGFSLVFTLHSFLLRDLLKPRGAVPPWGTTILPVVTLGGSGDNLSASIDGEAQIATETPMVLFLTLASPAFDWVGAAQEFAPISRPPMAPWMTPLSVLGGAQGKYAFTDGRQLRRDDTSETIPMEALRGLFR